MEYLPEDKKLEYKEDTLNAVRKFYDLDKPGVMKGAVDILEAWVREQKHFTKKDFDRRYLETTIIASKGSIERAKQRLDRSCTFRTLKPDLFGIPDVRYIHKTDLKDVSHALLPKMTKDYERVYILRNDGKTFAPTIARSFVSLIPTYCEYFRLKDYASKYNLVIDWTDCNIAELAPHLSISLIQEVVAYLLDCCGFRMKSLYIISSSKLVEIAVAICKQVLSAKLSARVHVLQDRSLVQNFIEKDILPKEYGGNEKSVDELCKEWFDVLTSEDHIKYMKEINSARTDETLRQKDTFSDQYMGMPGTFRTLSVD